MLKWDSQKEEPMRLCTECKGKGFIEADECTFCMGWGAIYEEEDYAEEYELDRFEDEHLEQQYDDRFAYDEALSSYEEGGCDYDNYDDPYDGEHEAP